MHQLNEIHKFDSSYNYFFISITYNSHYLVATANTVATSTKPPYMIPRIQDNLMLGLDFLSSGFLGEPNPKLNLFSLQYCITPYMKVATNTNSVT